MEQIRALRARLNKALQALESTDAIKEYGRVFEEAYGGSIWACNCKGQETFADLYNDHLSREREREEDREINDARALNIIKEIGETCNQKEWWSCKWFVNSRKDLNDDQNVLDCLDERRQFLDIPEEGEE